MTSERWTRVTELVADALEHDADQRAAFIENACAGDSVLLGEVQSLLRHSGKGRVEAFADDLAWAQQERRDSRIGQAVGDYRIVEAIGRGGMGAVYLGERADHEFEKQVAIKILKRGTDTEEVLYRFQRERQILARLAHPNIAHLLDAGTTADGLPFFVMEYVEGMRLIDFAQTKSLSLRERLQLFLKICAAVQFAHQNLIVHRDLKPGNILVTAEGEPKLLDFGVAKLLAEGDDVWQVTMAGQERFTPGYASPEQVRGEPITTVSDVYALGALFYELLTGQPPHRFGKSIPTGSEIARVVCEEEPVRPSAAAREPEMQRSLRGDLDRIVLRALAKDPARRYRGASHLADDIRRFLENRPVRARPDTVGYRAGKFLRRNKAAVAAAVLILTAVLGGAASTLWHARRAERRFNDVRKIANSFMFEFHDAIKDLPGGLAARQLVTQRAVEYLDTLAQEAGNDLSLRRELAIAYDRIGSITFDIGRGTETVRKAVALNEALVAAAPQNIDYAVQLAETYRTLSDMLKISGQSEQAIRYARRGLGAMQSLAARMPANSETQLLFGQHHMTVAVALDDAGDFRGALQYELAAREWQKKALAGEPHDADALRDLAAGYGRLSNLYADTGEIERALECAREELNSRRPLLDAEPANTRYRRQVWSGHFHLGHRLVAKGEPEQALGHFREAANLMEGLAEADPGDKGHRRWLAMTYSAMGEALASLEQNAEAFARQEKAIAISEELAREDPVRVESRRDLVKLYLAAGRLLIPGEDQRAREFFQRANPLGESLYEKDPRNARIGSALADVLGAMAESEQRLGGEVDDSSPERVFKLRTARELYSHSLALWQGIESNGMLSSGGAPKFEAVRRGLKECNEALAVGSR